MIIAIEVIQIKVIALIEWLQAHKEILRKKVCQILNEPLPKEGEDYKILVGQTLWSFSKGGFTIIIQLNH